VLDIARSQSILIGRAALPRLAPPLIIGDPFEIREVEMKTCRFFVFALLIVLCAAASFADSSADPGIIIRDPTCAEGCNPVGLQFNFGTPSSGTGELNFLNASGVDWYNLKLVESGVNADIISCFTDAFLSCTVTTVDGVTTILLSGVNENYTGIGADHAFDIIFGCPEGMTCEPWPGDLDFHAIANVPEPGSMALMITGIGAVIARRRKARRA
jgi:hypothetical protein